MWYRNRWMVVILIVAALQLTACVRNPVATTKSVPAAKMESIEGTDLHRVVLTEKAAERLDIQTAPVRAEQLTRMRRVGGRVVALPVDSTMKTASASGTATVGVRATADPSQVRVLLRLSKSDLNKVDRSQPARVQPLAGDDDEDRDDEGGLTAEPDDDFDDPGDPAETDPEEDVASLYYTVNGTNHGLTPGQPVFVEVSLSDNGTQRKIVPFAAVIYGLHGETWVYTNPEPLVFVRQPVTVDYVEDDLAVLSEGPPAGAQVVTVGGAELFGVESGVGGGH